MTRHSDSQVTLRIRIHCGDLIAMGPGKADLLAAIDAEGSISAAGRKMGLSYRKVRLMVDAMNACFKEPLVDAVKGGAQGGGACLTPLGKEALTRYQRLQAKAQASIERELKAYVDLLGTAPRC